MEINDANKNLIMLLGAAINSAIEQSSEVNDVLADLRDNGYDSSLTVHLEIGLRKIDDQIDEFSNNSGEFEFSDEDIRILQNMKIKL